MEAVDKRLVDRDHALVRLLDPPFDTSNLNPGYIKGYVPGVRENGGQYTHGAIWAAMAFATLGDSRRAWELLAMINPLNHARSPEEIAIYKVEPYVVAADMRSRASPRWVDIRARPDGCTGSSGALLGLRLERIG
jgi:cellobiose phosphorylase